MLKNLSIRLKIALIYVEIVIFTLPMLIAAYLIMRHLNTMQAHAGEQIVSIFGIVCVAYVVVYLAVTLMLGRKLTSLIAFPLRDLEKIASKIAAGDVSDLPGYRSNDEVGKLADEFRKMLEAINQQSNILSTMAGGDYTVSIPIRSENDIMNRSINQLIDRNNEMLRQINASTAQVSNGSKQVAHGAQSLAQGSTEQASAIEELSASINAIASKTMQNAEIAKEASNLSGIIKGNAEKGSVQMEQMMQAVREINDASGRISRVIKVIDDIAFQTNILALNAAVEAARAGQHGKGFAVVAEEVRTLAAKSADAAKDTGGLIENSIEKANFGLNIATRTSASLEEIVDGINRSAEIITQIAVSSDEQTSSISQVNTGISQVAQVIQQNSATAEESAAASEEMSGQSEMLERLVAQFKLKDTEYGLKNIHGDEPHNEIAAASMNTALAVSERDSVAYGKY